MKPNRSRLASFRLVSNYSYYDWTGARQYRDFPVRVSIPLAQGVSTKGDSVELRDEQGKVVLCHSNPFVKWPDGSTRVWELWFPASFRREETRHFQLHRAPAPAQSKIKNQKSKISPRFTISARLGNGSRVSQRVVFDPASLVEAERTFTLARSPRSVAFRGAMVRRSWGWYPGIELEIRVTNFAPTDTLKVRGVRLEFELPVKGKLRYCIRQTTITAKDHPRLVESASPFEVRADEKGIHVTDPAQLGEDESDYPQYERGAYLCSVDRWIGVADAEAGWLLVVPDAFERHPKAWRIKGNKVTVDLHPEHAKPLDWRQGMTLFQRIQLVRLPARAATSEFENEAQAWLRPPILRLDPGVYRVAGWRIPFGYEPKRFPKTEFQFRDLFQFSWSRGTFDWGDATWDWGSPAQGIRRSGRNLEYDFVAVAAKEYARTGGVHMLKLLRSSAEHMMYTDFIAHSSDQWKEGGIAAHGPEHTWGACYPSHMWAEGLILYYQLTGDRYALVVAKRVGDFFLKHIRERFAVVQGTPREMGWLLIAVEAIYDLTREPRYLEGIKRVVDYNLDLGPKGFFPVDATFAMGVSIIGLNRTRLHYRGADTKKFILGLLDHLMENRRDEIGLFEYWRDSEQGIIPFIQTHLPEGLNIGYKLSGDQRYLRAAFRLYQIHQGGGVMTVQNRFAAPECGFAAGSHISWMGCLQSFAEKGWLDSMQYPNPR